MKIDGMEVNMSRLYQECANNKVTVIKRIRELTGFGLKEAKEAVDLYERSGEDAEYNSKVVNEEISAADDGCIMEFKGANGVIKLYEDRLTITRRGFRGVLGHGIFQGTKDILLTSITGIQVKKSGLVTVGYIQFTILGGNEGKKGLAEATSDENTVTFDGGMNKQAEELKNKIYELQRLARTPVAQAVASTAKEISPADEIRKYKQLLDDGILTQEEFDAKKKQLLGL